MVAIRFVKCFAIAAALTLSVGCSHRCTNPNRSCQVGPPREKAGNPVPCECVKSGVLIKPGCSDTRIGPCNPCAKQVTMVPLKQSAVAQPVQQQPVPYSPLPMPRELNLPPPSLKGYPTAAATVHRPVVFEANDKPGLCRAPDYSWVIGELRFLHTRRCWQVRYAPLTMDDTYGGAFLLNSVDHLTDHFREGMMVKVEGVLVDPGRRAPSPNYWVHRIVAIRENGAAETAQPVVATQSAPLVITPVRLERAR